MIVKQICITKCFKCSVFSNNVKYVENATEMRAQLCSVLDNDVRCAVMEHFFFGRRNVRIWNSHCAQCIVIATVIVIVGHHVRRSVSSSPL
ncbi:hypothetical protein X975_25058, partial [Stegodyphus mimosarum]